MIPPIWREGKPLGLNGNKKTPGISAEGRNEFHAALAVEASNPSIDSLQSWPQRIRPCQCCRLTGWGTVVSPPASWQESLEAS
jgi:hypothetical protein